MNRFYFTQYSQNIISICNRYANVLETFHVVFTLSLRYLACVLHTPHFSAETSPVLTSSPQALLAQP